MPDNAEPRPDAASDLIGLSEALRPLADEPHRPPWLANLGKFVDWLDSVASDVVSDEVDRDVDALIAGAQQDNA